MRTITSDSTARSAGAGSRRRERIDAIGYDSAMRCSALTAKGEPCKSKAGPSGYCKRHQPDALVAHEMSTAELRLRTEAAHIVARVRAGSSPVSAFGASGFTAAQCRQALAVGDGGHLDITDEGYREACESLSGMLHASQSERDGELAAAWREMAMGDWRAAKAYLETRSPDEWTATQQISIDADVNVRGDDEVLAALAALRGETSGE